MVPVRLLFWVMLKDKVYSNNTKLNTIPNKAFRMIQCVVGMTCS